MSHRVAEARKLRDLYADMMRLENPDFGFFSVEELQANLEKEQLEKEDDESSTRPYTCCTQEGDTIEDLFIGENRGTVELWKSGSVINWTARRDGYPTFQDALETAIKTYRATQHWNEVLQNRVTFRYVSRGDDAAFMLQYGGKGYGTLARSFFPSKWRNTLNTLTVFEQQYTPEYRGQLFNTQLHELGHILGLRHEHSQSKYETAYGSFVEDAKGAESILWGVRNPKSIMAYHPSPSIQQSDINGIRSAYDTLADGRTINGQGLFGLISKTIRRVEPNN